MNTSLPESNMAAAAQSTPDQINKYDPVSAAEKTAAKVAKPSSKRKIDIDPDQLRDMLLDSIGEALKDHSKFHSPKAFSRHTNKLSLENVVNLIYFMTGSNLNVVLTKYFGIDDLCPDKSSLTEARLKLDPKFFAKIFYSFMTKLLPYLPEERDLYGMAFLAIDGSNLPLETFNKELEDLSKTRTVKKDNLASKDEEKDNERAGIYINGVYTMDRCHLFIDFELQRIRKRNETEVACQLVLLQPKNAKCCFTMDRDYHCFKLEHLIASRGNYYLIRMKEVDFCKLLGVKAEDLQGEIDQDVHKILAPTKGKGFALKRRMNPDKEYYKVSPDTFDFDEISECKFTCRLVRLEIQDGSYEYLITNLPRDQYDISSIRCIYNNRWSIEGGFRDLKFGTGLQAVHARKMELIQQEIYAAMALHNFSSALVLAAQQQEEEQIAKGEKKPVNPNRKINCLFVFQTCRELLFDPFLNVWTYLKQVLRHKVTVKPGRKFRRKVMKKYYSNQHRIR